MNHRPFCYRERWTGRWRSPVRRTQQQYNHARYNNG